MSLVCIRNKEMLYYAHLKDVTYKFIAPEEGIACTKGLYEEKLDACVGLGLGTGMALGLGFGTDRDVNGKSVTL